MYRINRDPSGKLRLIVPEPVIIQPYLRIKPLTIIAEMCREDVGIRMAIFLVVLLTPHIVAVFFPLVPPLIGDPDYRSQYILQIVVLVCTAQASSAAFVNTRMKLHSGANLSIFTFNYSSL